MSSPQDNNRLRQQDLLTLDYQQLRLRLSGKVVVLVDSDAASQQRLHRFLENGGLTVRSFDNAATALETFVASTNVILLDWDADGSTGAANLRYLRRHHAQCIPVVLCGGDLKRVNQIRRDAAQGGAVAVLHKSTPPNELLRCIDTFLKEQKDQHALPEKITNTGRRESDRRQNRAPNNTPDTLPSTASTLTDGTHRDAASANSPSDQNENLLIDDALRRHIDTIAQHDASVMLSGESGTGKTAVAKLIHSMSVKRHGPFVSVNCASMPRDLIESELFGHRRGAFTGAISDRIGKSQMADGGTLFLDEIGDLPLDLQPKLLTFLQDRVVEPIGSNESRRVDVRIIVATHRNLRLACRQQTFREDLFYRLNVLQIHMPPLREQPNRVIQLAMETVQRWHVDL
ncbi:MAG: sigma 54-interacting transcriptional regulator [Planctomycetota bacterium]